MAKIEIEAKDVFNMTWNYFQQHAQQRIAYFNYFVVFQACMTTGLLATFKPEFKAHLIGVGIGLLQILISFVFWKIDERNKFLTKHGESAVKEFEQNYSFLKYNKSKPSPIFLFSSEAVDTKKLRKADKEKKIWKRQMSHSKCCNLMFIIFAVIGVIGALSSGIYSAICYIDNHKMPTANKTCPFMAIGKSKNLQTSRVLFLDGKSVSKYQKVLRMAKDRDVNESDTVAIITDVLADVFGYDKYMEITSEFAIRNTYCDLAIKIDDKVQFLIEVKAIGIKLKETHLKQAIDYGANKGIEWVILTNSIEWEIYRIKFEQPINYDLVCSFDFLEVSPRKEKDQELLFMLSKEGLSKEFRDDFYQRVQSVNRFVISGILLNDAVLNCIRKELRKLTDGLKVDASEVGQIIKDEILKRELVESDEAKSALGRVNRFYKKQSKVVKKKVSAVGLMPSRE